MGKETCKSTTQQEEQNKLKKKVGMMVGWGRVMVGCGGGIRSVGGLKAKVFGYKLSAEGGEMGGEI